MSTHWINLFQGDFPNVLLDAVILAHVGMAATENKPETGVNIIRKCLNVHVCKTFYDFQRYICFINRILFAQDFSKSKDLV